MRRIFDRQSWLPHFAKRGSIIVCASILVSALQGIALGAGLELYPTDLGTAHAGQAALAENASTAASNPAGMTLLDRSQLMTSPGALLPSTNFDVAPETTTKGGGGGNAGVFFPYGGFFYAHKLSEQLRLGVAVYSDYGLNGNFGKTWVGRYYITEASLVSGKVNPSIAYEVNNWLSVGAGFSFGVARLTFQSKINNAFQGVPDGGLSL
ncbi:MAG: OmpP1/FadL family transporter, partial [Beijerinckiaceae bacterium]